MTTEKVHASERLSDLKEINSTIPLAYSDPLSNSTLRLDSLVNVKYYSSTGKETNVSTIDSNKSFQAELATQITKLIKQVSLSTDGKKELSILMDGSLDFTPYLPESTKISKFFINIGNPIYSKSITAENYTDLPQKSLDFTNKNIVFQLPVGSSYTISFDFFMNTSDHIKFSIIRFNLADLSKASIQAKDTTLVAGPDSKWELKNSVEKVFDAAGNEIAITNAKVISGKVNPQVPGDYVLQYEYLDVFGNSIQSSSTIHVLASQAAIETKELTLIAGSNTAWKPEDSFLSAKDAKGETISLASLTVSDSVNPQVPGDYEVTYSYNDEAGNSISSTATVHVLASKAVIETKDLTLIAGPNTAWKPEDSFLSAKDAKGETISLASLTVSDSVNPQAPGDYEVTYSYNDEVGNSISSTATVHVLASQATIETKDLTLIAGPNTTWKPEDSFSFAKDEQGNELPLALLTISGSVNPQVPGNYEVVYSYNDEVGNSISSTATVHVLASQATIETKDLTLIAGPNTTWKPEDSFSFAKDEQGNELSLALLTISGSVNPQVPGEYEVTYSYNDVTGNLIISSSIVTIKPLEAPKPDDEPLEPSVPEEPTEPSVPVEPSEPSVTEESTNQMQQLSSQHKEIPLYNEKQLPNTGEKNSSLLVIIGELFIFAGSCLFAKNRFRKQSIKTSSPVKNQNK